MWMLHNRTPFAGERAWVRDKDGTEVWLTAIKGTFLIAPDGSTRPADEQVPVTLAPLYRGEPDKSSLLADTDLNHTKTATDVLLHGHAYAPDGKRATAVDVTLKVARVHKTLRVFGDRVWEKGVLGLHMSAPEPFTKMPILYERAYGGADLRSENPRERGWEPRNLVGVGFAMRAEDLIGKPVANVEDPAGLINTWRSHPRPAGFGPVPGHWEPRRRFGGTYDEAWRENRLPLLPDDFDVRFYQCAPEDQQVPGFLRGGEPVELVNLTPGGLLRFALPRVTLGFVTSFGGDDFVHHRPVLHTVLIEPDVPRVVMVWHTHLPCHHKVLKLLDTTVVVKERLNAAGGRKP
jgi:hypothetical protein